MALSNWDTCALNTEGKPCNGVLSIQHEDGSAAHVIFYKNWLYIRDEGMWADGRSYTKPTIAEVWDGHINIANFDIYAKRGSQNSILAYVSTGWRHKNTFQCMVGVGCYGFAGEEFVGVLPKTYQELLTFLHELKEDSVLAEEDWQTYASAKPLRFNQGDGYFANNLDDDNLNQPTILGEAHTPILLKFLGKK